MSNIKTFPGILIVTVFDSIEYGVSHQITNVIWESTLFFKKQVFSLRLFLL